MRKTSIAAAAALALTPACVPPAWASDAGQNDVAATRAYLSARHRLALAGQHDLKAGGADVQALVEKVKAECPGVLAGAPDNRARDEVRGEIGEDVLLTFESPSRGATLKFARTVQHLRWSNRRLTYYATHSAKEEAAKARIPLPALCADAKSLADGGFQTVPPGTRTFLQRSLDANSITTISGDNGESGDLEERIAHLLKPYLRRDDKRLLPRKPTRREIARLIALLEREVVTPTVEIAHVLGLPE